MKKRILLTALMIFVFVCVFAFTVSAQETTVDDSDFVGGKLYKNSTNEFGTVNIASDTSTVYYFTSTLDTTARMVLKNADGTYSTYPTIYVMYTVTDAQGPRWGFDKLSAIAGETYDIESVARMEFPEGTNHVRGSSFVDSTELVYVKIASTIREIKGNAFQRCVNLSKVEFALNFEKYPEFGSNLYSINNGAVFNGCTSLTELVLPNSVVMVNSSAITGCTNLKLFNPGASFAGTNNQPIGGPSEAFILSSAYKGNYMLFSYDRINKPNKPTTLVFYYTGTLAQAQHLQEIETQCYEIKYGTLISYSEFTAENFVRDEKLYYFVYDYNYCEAFYNGEHNKVVKNNCVSTCTVCNLVINEHNDSEKETVTVSYDGGFMADGVKKTVCTNEDCKYSVTVTAPALFVSEGYSIPEDGRGEIAICFTVNKTALQEYETYTGDTLVYGAFAVAYDKITDEGIDAVDDVVKAEVQREYFSFEMKITGITDVHKNTKLSFGAFITHKDGKVTYLQKGTPQDGKYSYVTYSDIANA